MTTTLTESAPLWTVYRPLEPATDAHPAIEPSWRGVLLSIGEDRAGRSRTASRYERFTTRVVVVSSLLLLGFTACLHVFNYGLQTQTSSTSGTHSGFYGGEPGELDSEDG